VPALANADARRPTGTLLMLATFGMELVECGGAIAKHVRAGGSAHAAVAFSRPEARTQIAAAAAVLGVTEVRFMDVDPGDVRSTAETKLPFVRLVREWRPVLAIMQDPVHAFGDLDPGRRDIMPVYLEALALAGRDWRPEEAGGAPPHQVEAIYYMTPTTPNCVVDVADVWDLKVRAMDALESQLAFSGRHYRDRLGAAALRRLAPDAAPEGDDLALGRAVHRVTDLAFHVTHGVHSHAGLALAEPYRREGVFPFERLP
jgi:LmbE family N-acetylglucosaminyl deacetylase